MNTAGPTRKLERKGKEKISKRRHGVQCNDQHHRRLQKCPRVPLGGCYQSTTSSGSTALSASGQARGQLFPLVIRQQP